jgi:hypothetical protein
VGDAVRADNENQAGRDKNQAGRNEIKARRNDFQARRNKIKISNRCHDRLFSMSYEENGAFLSARRPPSKKERLRSGHYERV